MSDPVATWRDTATRQAIEDFIERAARDVPPEERVAVFDNDGTLWCEKPMPIELGFVLKRLAEMADEDASLRVRQPWQSAYARDYEWLGGVVTKHYAGDDSDVISRGAGRVRRRSGEARPHLEPHRAAADSRRRELEGRRADASTSPAGRPGPHCACSCSTTTRSVSSITPRRGCRARARAG